MIRKPSGAEHLGEWLLRSVVRSLLAYLVVCLLTFAGLTVLWLGDPQDRDEASAFFGLLTVGAFVVGVAVAVATALTALGLYPLGWHASAPVFRLLAVVTVPLVFAGLAAAVRPAPALLAVAAAVGLVVSAVVPHPGRHRRTDADLLQAWQLES